MRLTFDVCSFCATLDATLCDLCCFSVFARLKIHFHQIKLKSLSIAQLSGFRIALLGFVKILHRRAPIAVNARQISPTSSLSLLIVYVLKEFEGFFRFSDRILPRADEAIQFAGRQMRVCAVFNIPGLTCDLNCFTKHSEGVVKLSLFSIKLTQEIV